MEAVEQIEDVDDRQVERPDRLAKRSGCWHGRWMYYSISNISDESDNDRLKYKERLPSNTYLMMIKPS